MGPIEPATKRSSPTAWRAISAARWLISSVCVAQPPLVELQPRGLERVRLHDLGAGGDHRLVHALDDVRAVEHQRLVAAPGELVVALQAQVELLERGAHAAVEDDDAVAGGGEEITHSAQASATLTQLWQGCRRPRRGGAGPPARRRRGRRRCGQPQRRRGHVAAREPGRVRERGDVDQRPREAEHLAQLAQRKAGREHAPGRGARRAARARTARPRRRRSPTRPAPGRAPRRARAGAARRRRSSARGRGRRTGPPRPARRRCRPRRSPRGRAAQAARDVAVASSGSARPPVSSARRRSTAWTV